MRSPRTYRQPPRRTGKGRGGWASSGSPHRWHANPLEARAASPVNGKSPATTLAPHGWTDLPALRPPRRPARRGHRVDDGLSLLLRPQPLRLAAAGLLPRPVLDLAAHL